MCSVSPTTTLMSDPDGRLSALLLEIDAAVLQAYDLPPRLEHMLLSYFPAEGRPVAPPLAALECT